MFREMRRFKQQITTEECKKVLKEEKRAAFSVIGDDGYPYTIPINFYYDEADNIIYFHGAKEGHKVDAMNRCDKVCLTVWNQGFKKEGHWEWNPTSVVVFGKVKLVTEKNIFEDRLRKLAAKYYPNIDEIEKEMEVYYFSPTGGTKKVLSKEIADALEKADPDHKDIYQENASAYSEKLKDLDAKYQEVVDGASQKTLLFGDRFPFRYLVDDYGLSYYAAFVG